ncbi:MAG: FtsQ-type POTRA domain-containing protein [Oscillospiraceae bacterium]|nr:FtsQ-type POTRA domain-containing protein [Oscillospiraceae bacterium]
MTERKLSARRGRRILLLLFLSLLLFLLALMLFFRVTEIQIEGDPGAYDPAEILKVSGIHKGESLFLLKAETASEAIQKAFPALSSALVRVRFPGLVTISVNESQVRAVLELDGTRWVFDENGHVLGNAETGKAYIRVTGLTAKEAKVGQELKTDTAMTNTLAYTKTILTQMNEWGLADGITQVNMENLAHIEVTWGHFTVLFGAGTKLEYKVERLAAVLPMLQEQGEEKGTIDLSDNERTDFIP